MVSSSGLSSSGMFSAPGPGWLVGSSGGRMNGSGMVASFIWSGLGECDPRLRACYAVNGELAGLLEGAYGVAGLRPILRVGPQRRLRPVGVEALLHPLHVAAVHERPAGRVREVPA